jgi:hypothetical protein
MKRRSEALGATLPPITPASMLGNLTPSLREELLRALNEIVRNFRQRRWEPSELNGGKLCEAVYSILRGHVDGSLPVKPLKPPNMVDSCRALERAGHSLPRSVQIQIPRMLIALYEIRSNRGVAHAGGDVNPNHMDALAVVSMSKWIVAELVRIFHNADTDVATQIVDSLVEREIPIIWEVAGVKRVLSTALTMKDKALLLLYSHAVPLAESDLAKWTEHSNPSVFRRDVLRPAHRQKLIEYDARTGVVHLSPLGASYVEDNLPLSTG